MTKNLSNNDLNSQVIDNSDEIDLIALFLGIWKKKNLVLATTIIFIIIGGIYAFTAPQIWTSKANFSAPTTIEASNYINKVEIYDTIMRAHENQNQNQNQIIAKNVYDVFQNNLFLANLQIEFAKSTKIYKKLIQNEVSEEKALQYILNSLKFYFPDDKNKKDKDLINKGLFVDFSYTDPKNAQKFILDYVNFVDKITSKELLSNLKDLTKLKIQNLNMELKYMDNSIKNSRKIELEKLNQSLEIAKAAGVKNFQNNKFNLPNTVSEDAIIKLNSDEYKYSFLMGENYLKSQVKILSNKPLIYPSSYYLIQEQIKDLEDFYKNLNTNMKFKTYSYRTMPTYPITKDKPKRALILAASAMIGLILGLLIAIFSNALTEYKNRKK